MKFLGHKNIRNALIYVQLEEAPFKNREEEYVCKVTKTVKKAKELVERGIRVCLRGCAHCRYYMDGYCRYRRINVDEDESCRYFEPPKEMPLTPEGDQRLTVVIARKHAVAL